MFCFINSFCQPSATCLVTSLLYFTVSADRVQETTQLLTCETPDFIAPALWPANSPDLNPKQELVYRSRIHAVDQLNILKLSCTMEEVMPD